MTASFPIIMDLLYELDVSQDDLLGLFQYDAVVRRTAA
ncbi:hypothetical protein GMO_21680 [Gluconobacter morbifer G707]|uniref:Uncharacterized protein n=1 Tax=Gluconobacter morbifer G707 TaxID=1088869 RepID=G6XL02_9PROT|nr:hypothetical protein GMO_21680 [Gluconobacter morbifer G707]